MGIEFEVKFRATPRQQAALLAAYGKNPRVIQMETTYYDTEDSALSARRFTLRRRLENGISVCTLKTPIDDLGRGEFAVSCNTIEEAIPRLCKLSGVTDFLSLTKNGVQPVCGARFTRTAVTLETADYTLELALDAGVLCGGGKEIPLCEVELELISGQSDALITFANSIAGQYGLIPESGSKFRRALALCEDVM